MLKEGWMVGALEGADGGWLRVGLAAFAVGSGGGEERQV